jgi:hypothetical protein
MMETDIVSETLEFFSFLVLVIAREDLSHFVAVKASYPACFKSYQEGRRNDTTMVSKAI